MVFSEVVDAIISFATELNVVAIVKAASIGLFVVLVLKLIKSLTTRSPYDHIPGPQPSSMLGYLLDMHDPDNMDFHFKITEHYGHVARLKGGLLGSDGLYVSDPLALHTILVRDQNIFRESTEFIGLFGIINHGDAVGSVWGQEHKKQRKIMNPVFTAAYLSRLSPLFYKIANQLRERLEAEAKSGAVTLDILDDLTRTSLELVSQGGLGHTFDSFRKNSKAFLEFHEALKEILPSASKLFLILPYFQSWRNMKPVWLRRALAKTAYHVLPWPALRHFTDSIKTMQSVCTKIFQEKKAAMEQGGIEALISTASGGRDLTALFMQANIEADDEDKLHDDNIIGNMCGIVLGGQETTAGAMSRLLDLMTLNPALQDWVREEINEALAKKNGVPLDYYELNALPRLDALCREALRLFAPVTFVWRQTMQDHVVPLQYPIKDVKTGKDIHEIFIQKGTSVYVGLVAPNRSTALWGPDAAEFKPERWIGRHAHESTVEQVKTPGIFSNMMTFLGGGRACPGMKFALLEIKTVMSVLLPTFHFEKTKDVVDWRLGITLSPYVRGKEQEGPKVPMKISLIHPKK